MNFQPVRKQAQGSKSPLNKLTWEGTQSSWTHHQSKATLSQPLRCEHEDPWAHQSRKPTRASAHSSRTDLMTHMSASWTKLGAKGGGQRLADHLGQPTYHWARLPPASMWWSPIGCRRRFRAPQVSLPAEAPWFPPINTRGGGEKWNTTHIQLFTLFRSLELILEV